MYNKNKKQSLTINKDDLQHDVVICDCHSKEHQVIFSYFKDEHEDSVYVQVHLHNPSFWRRLRYLFGHKSELGAWGEVIIPKEKFAEMARRISSF